MSSARPLCRLCERPTADGAVQAVQVDKEKLQTWFLDLCQHELAEEIEDEDLICFFCIWHAEFLAKHVPGLDEISWWPADLDFLDDVGKELRNNYFEGRAEQCWVQLETIEYPESDIEENEEPRASTSAQQQKRKKCFYCGAIVVKINQHMRKKHKDAIRCEYRKCATYFHSLEEKEKHIHEEHEKSKERKLHDCKICGKRYAALKRLHMDSAHPEYPFKCTVSGCLSYFKFQEELNSHFEAAHKKEDEAKAFKCHFCEYKSKTKADLSTHISCKHLKKTIKCSKCDKMFATNEMLAWHKNRFHTYWVCTICSADCIVQYKTRHLKKLNCSRCKNKFECSGSYQAHLSSCKETQFKCDQCPKTFQIPALLDYHVKRKHGSWRGLKHKKLGFKCEPCKRYYSSAFCFKQHLRKVHTKKGFKQCAHCPKSFPHISYLKHHLAEKHDLIERKCKCDKCGKGFVSSRFLTYHMKNAHLVKKDRVSCTVCGKSTMAQSMSTHLIRIHGIRKGGIASK